MSDITKCKDEKCHLRKDCYRFMSIPEKKAQSYFMESPRKDDKCDFFYPMESDFKFGPLPNEQIR